MLGHFSDRDRFGKVFRDKTLGLFHIRHGLVPSLQDLRLPKHIRDCLLKAFCILETVHVVIIAVFPVKKLCHIHVIVIKITQEDMGQLLVQFRQVFPF